MANARSNRTPEEKLGLLREHLIERKPINALAEREGIYSLDLEQWKSRLFSHGAQVFREDTIPNGVKFEFEQFANQACIEAKVDGQARMSTARNMVNHLEQEWLAGIDDGLGTSDAVGRTFQRYGNLDAVVDCLRQPFWLRLLFFKDYRVHRMFVVLAYMFLMANSQFARDIHLSQFYPMSVSVTPVLLVNQMLDILMPLTIFLWPINTGIDRSRPVVSGLQKAMSVYSVKAMIGSVMLGFMILPLFHYFSQVPFFLVAVRHRQASLIQIGMIWALAMASVPALGCAAAEVFCAEGNVNQQVRMRLGTLLSRIESGTLFFS